VAGALETLWHNGHWVDLAVLITLAEMLALATWQRLNGTVLAWPSYGWNLLSGLCLMVALRLALTDGPWVLQASCLATSGVAHALDLRRRLRRRQAHA
jgi:hypothetical protein